MEKIEKYTFASLINKYKNLVGEEMVEIIISSLMPSDKEAAKEFRRDAKKVINKVKEQTPSYITEEQRAKIIINIIYKGLEYVFNDEELSNDIKRNKRFLMEIYRKFNDKMPKKQKNELVDLILGKDEYAVFTYLSDEYPGIVDVGIITRQKSKKISDIKDEEKRNLIKISLKHAWDNEYLDGVIKEEYSDEYIKLAAKALLEFCVKEGRMSADEYKNINAEDDIDDKTKGMFNQAILEYFENNYQFIDEEKLLLNMGAKLMLGLKVGNGEQINGVEINTIEDDEQQKEIAKQNSIALLRYIYIYLNPEKNKNKELEVPNADGEIVIKASKENIKQFLERCTYRDYITDARIQKIHDELLEGILTTDLQERKIAELDTNDLIKMNNAYKEENREEILSAAIELSEYLKQTEATSNDELIEMYLNKELDLNLVSKINIEDISDDYFVSKFKDIYNQAVGCKEVQQKQEIFGKLAKLTELFMEVEKQGRLKINKDEIVAEVLMNCNKNNMNQTVADLHKIGLINLEEAIGWTGTDTIIRRYEEGNLKPAEVRDCYNKDKISLDQLADIIKMIPENSERFMIIGGIFPEEEDIETRDILILECMELEENIKRREKGEKIKRNEGEGSNNYNKYITDPFARLSLIQGLDSEYSFEMAEDGHSIIKLPTLKKVIIEKMLDKDNLPSYGNATYLLNQEYYEKNHEEIVIGNKINRSRMIKDLENEGVDRIVHGIDSWGKNIKEYFGIEEESRWNDEDINKINDAIERIKRTYRTI